VTVLLGALSVALIALIAMSPAAVGAQRKIEISAVATPPTHEVKLTRRVVLTDAASPAKGGLGWLVAIDSRKRYYAPTSESRLLVFDSTGRFIQSVGRHGRGPGEFLNPFSVIVGAADTLYISEYGSLTALSQSYKFVRRTPMRGIPTIRLRRGGFAQITNTDAPEEINWLHLLEITDLTGKRVKVFDVGPPPERESLGRSRHIAEAPDGSIWCVMWGKYVLDQWDMSGKRRTILTRVLDGDSFKGFSDIPFNEPQILDLRFDQSGLLWVIVGVRNGKTHRATVRTEDGMRQMDLPEFDMIVDVVDLQRSKLLASTRLPSITRMALIGPAVGSLYMELDDGSIGIEVVDLSLAPLH
jgi:hypothetical protein